MGESEFPFPDFFPEDWGDDSDEPADGAERPDGEGAPDGGRPEPDEEFPGQLVLRGQNASEILRRLCNGDPLDFAGRTLQRIRERALLMDSARLAMRSMAYVAHAGRAYRGEPSLAQWIDQQIDRAIQDFLEEDAYEEASGKPLGEPVDERYAFLVDLLGIPPAKARKACIVFNGLPNKDRRTFWAVCVEGKSIHRYVAEGHGPPKKIKQRIDKVFRALSFLDEEPPAGFSLDGGFL
ncbi:MAG: hypothetical protein H6831_00845 [Planctomycetes bacterium]|nr:hypothetical protein [Planctomycetota bacterium]